MDFAFDDNCSLQLESSSGVVNKDHICSIKIGENKKGCETKYVSQIDATDWSDFYPRLPTHSAIDDTDFLDDDIRPKFFDNVTKQWVLIDSGAMVTVFPHTMYPNAKPDKKPLLQAVNGTVIDTFGRQMVSIQIGRKFYSHNAVVANISEPIVGWDLMRAHKLSLIWDDDGELRLHDRKAAIRTETKLSHFNPDMAQISLITDTVQDHGKDGSKFFRNFQEYSQKQSVLANKQARKTPIPPRYRELLDKYPSLLKTDFTTEARHKIRHHIDTGENKPCRAKMRPIMPGSPKAVEGERQWRELERLGVVEPVDPAEATTWSSALHLAPKADGSLRCCGDFRNLNNLTILDSYPLPNLRHFVGELKDAKVFSKIDLVKAFHQVPLDDVSKPKTTVLTPWGAYMFARLPMGLKNAAQSFQKMMASILSGIKGLFVYLDDVLVFSKDKDHHYEIIEEMFKRLEENGLAISLDKCEFEKDTINFVGYEVTAEGIKPLPKKVEAIVGFPRPPKQKHLLGFLGALNYYRRSLPMVNGKTAAEILQPLYTAATIKLPPKMTFERYWSENNLDVDFQNAKNLLLKATALVHPDPQAPKALTTDASDKAVGGVLEQFSDGRWQPIGFWSKHLPKDKQKWTVYRRELYAVHQAMRHFLQDFDGQHLVIWTDHKPLLGSFSSDHPQPHDPIANNMIMEISQWTNDVRFVAGKANAVADLLSRPPEVPLGSAYTISNEDYIRLDAVKLSTVDHKAMAAAQLLSPDVIHHKKGRHPKNVVMETVDFGDGIELYCEVAGQRARPMVPESFRQQIMNLYHQQGHFGPNRTKKRIGDQYYWPNLPSDVTAFAQKCMPCQQTKPYKTIRPEVTQRPVPDTRFSSIQCDVVGPMPVSRGMRYLFTCFDRTTRYFAAMPIAEATASACLDALLNGWIQYFGLPEEAESDNGNTFISNLWTDIQSALGVEVLYTPPYHPSSLGGVERKHRDLKLSLKASLLEMGDKSGHKWMEKLPWIMLSQNSAYQPDLGATPAELVLGSNPTVPGDPPRKIDESTPAHIKDLLEALRRNAAQQHVPMSHHRKESVNVPDSLARTTHVFIRRAKTGVLGHAFEGPYEITERVGESCVRLRVGSKANGEPRFQLHHWNNLKPAVVSEGDPVVEKARPGRKKKAVVPPVAVVPPSEATGPAFATRSKTTISPITYRIY